jgi:hypothetical protein
VLDPKFSIWFYGEKLHDDDEKLIRHG